METFQYGPHSIRYVRRGTGAPLVLLHNGGTSHAIWTDVVPLLDGYGIFALDLLGFGASSKPGRDYELDTHVDILSAFIDAHALAPVFLVGNCMGSAISLSFAIRRPEAVRAMVLINTLTTGTFAKGIYGPMKSWPDRAPGLVSLMSKIPVGARFGRFGVRSQLGKAGIARRVHDREELRAGYASAAQSHALLSILADIPHYAPLDRFVPPPDFPPICTVWGLENRVLRAKEGRAFVDTLNPARQEWLEGCGHLPMLDRPDSVAAIVNEFFANTASRKAEAT